MAVVTATLLASGTCYAKRMATETEKVSVEGTVKSVEKQLKEHPKDEILLYRLAQVHATAYASKETMIEVVKGTDRPWYGYRYTGIPYNVVETDDKEAQARAQEHLLWTVELHEKLVKINPNHFHARLGLAWCMEQVGNIEGAKKLYRALIKDALPKDRETRMAEAGTVTVSSAASLQLIKILQAEIDALKKQSEETEKNIRRIMV